jgi:hypothetical protein
MLVIKNVYWFIIVLNVKLLVYVYFTLWEMIKNITLCVSSRITFEICYPHYVWYREGSSYVRKIRLDWYRRHKSGQVILLLTISQLGNPSWPGAPNCDSWPYFSLEENVGIVFRGASTLMGARGCHVSCKYSCSCMSLRYYYYYYYYYYYFQTLLGVTCLKTPFINATHTV